MTAVKEGHAALELRARPPRVARLSRAAIGIIVGVGTLTVLLAAWWALRPPTLRDLVEPELHVPDRVQRPEGIERLPRDYASLPRKPPQLGAPLPGELGRPVERAEREAGIPQLPPAPTFRSDPAEDAARAKQLDAAREQEAAARADVLFRLRQPVAQAAPSATRDVGALHPETPEDGARASTAAREPERMAVDSKSEDAHVRTQVIAAPSGLSLLAGTVIPAALITGINSDIPGRAIAAVTQDVHDSVTGQTVLIPQGTRLIGRYDTQVAFGQRRLHVVWTRLIRPDGSSLSLDNLPGTDPAGLAGLEDQVDAHWKDVLIGAALSTLIGIGAELAAPDSRADDRVIVATRQSAQDTVNQVGQQVTRRGLEVRPTLTVRPGFPIRIIVSRDLRFTTTSRSIEALPNDLG